MTVSETCCHSSSSNQQANKSDNPLTSRPTENEALCCKKMKERAPTSKKQSIIQILISIIETFKRSNLHVKYIFFKPFPSLFTCACVLGRPI